MRCLCHILLALSPLLAGAQQPGQLLDRYLATGDAAALEACRAKLASQPATFQTRLQRARLALLSGDSRAALSEARTLHREAPDELDAYALIVDSALDVGDIAAAEDAAQWMLNLRPEDVRALRGVASVRFAIHDYEGAAAMLGEAYRRTLPTEAMLRAAILTDLARSAAARGLADLSRRWASQAVREVPSYKPAQEFL